MSMGLAPGSRGSSRNYKNFGLLRKLPMKHSYSWQSVKHKIEDLTIKQKAILEEEETGTTQINEDPLNQVIDEWIEIWDAVKEEEASQKLSKAQQEKNASIATEYRANLLKAMSEKRVLDSNEDMEIGPVPSQTPASQAQPIHFKKQHQKPWADDEISKKMMNTLQKVGDTLIKETETDQVDDRIESLAKEMKEVKKDLDEQKDQLALILSLLQKKE